MVYCCIQKDGRILLNANNTNTRTPYDIVRKNIDYFDVDDIIELGDLGYECIKVSQHNYLLTRG